jgi:2'-5' RNA ligase
MAKLGLSAYLHNSNNRPHLTLTMYTMLGIPTACKRLENFATEHPCFPVSFQYFGTFPGESSSVFLGPVVDTTLLSIQSAICETLDSLGTVPNFHHYRPGHWVPHCSLAVELQPKICPQAITFASGRLKLPLKAEVREIGLIEFRPVRHICSFPLANSSASKETS